MLVVDTGIYNISFSWNASLVKYFGRNISAGNGELFGKWIKIKIVTWPSNYFWLHWAHAAESKKWIVCLTVTLWQCRISVNTSCGKEAMHDTSPELVPEVPLKLNGFVEGVHIVCVYKLVHLRSRREKNGIVKLIVNCDCWRSRK